jgi:hypothetical protein
LLSQSSPQQPQGRQQPTLRASLTIHSETEQKPPKKNTNINFRRRSGSHTSISKDRLILPEDLFPESFSTRAIRQKQQQKTNNPSPPVQDTFPDTVFDDFKEFFSRLRNT